MANIPHTYRRGAIYWFRKVLRLSDGRRLDIRLSMDTARPAEARVASQVLAVATPGVTRMLDDKLSRERWLTDDDLRLMANAAYQQTLAQLRTAERKTPLEVETVLAPVWLGMHDLLSLIEADPLQALALERLEPKLREFGFDEGRLQNLRHIADLTGGGATAVTIEMVDQQLHERGYAVTDRNRLAARLAMIPAVKDAYAVALHGADPVSVPGPQIPSALVATPPAANPSQAADPLTISEAMEACISFRRGANELSGDSLAQIRQAVGLFVFANSDLRIAELRQAHAGRFVNLMTQLPKNYGRTREELAGGLPASLERAKRLDPDKVGLSGQTRNKHITWVENVIDHARKHLGVRPSEPVDFKELRSKEAKGSTLPRVPWHDHEIRTMLQAPPWFGCAGLFDRLTPGEHIWHDAWYFIPPGLALHGCRSDEFAGLATDEVFLDVPIPYFILRDNKFRTIKTRSSFRILPIASEFIRLGFVDYVREMKQLGHKLVFPEMYSPANQSGFDSTFYATIFSKLRSHSFPEGTEWFQQIGGIKEKDVHSLRGSTANILLGKVEDSIREDILGHSGKSTTRKHYDEPAALELKLEAIDKLSFLTADIETSPLNLRPKEWQRHGQPRGRPANGGRGVLPKRPNRTGRRKKG